MMLKFLRVLFFLPVVIIAKDKVKTFNGWRTEPDFVRQNINIRNITSNRTLLAPGYLFLAPELYGRGWGPKIYDQDGHLIWDGHDVFTGIARTFGVCDYLGESGTHLCWHEAGVLGPMRKKGDAWEQHRIFDSTYTQVGSNYTKQGHIEGHKGQGHIDSHEFRVVENGHIYLQTVNAKKAMDLREWGGPEKGFLTDNCMQELNLKTGEPLYSWCVQHQMGIETTIFPTSENQTRFSTPIGGEGDWYLPWDFCHLNSIDKNDEGDYLLSLRHNNQVLKLAGPSSRNDRPGKILWRLGGKSNDFIYDKPFIFSRQHHARFVSTAAHETLITLYDNAWEGVMTRKQSSQPYSSGKLVSINNRTMTARLVQEYRHPDDKRSQMDGSVQSLPNGNIFIGWGFMREVSEFSRDGKLLYHADVHQDPQVANYRNFKYPWIGKPTSSPKLLAYMYRCNGTPLLAYLSWNGATEVVYWAAWTAHSQQGPWIPVGMFKKVDFETRIELGHEFYPWVSADAHDKDGHRLGAVTSQTFVPTTNTRESCNEDGCFDEEYLRYEPHCSKADHCVLSPWRVDTIVPLTILAFFIEALSWTFTAILCARIRPSAACKDARHTKLESLSRKSNGTHSNNAVIEFELWEYDSGNGAESSAEGPSADGQSGQDDH